MKFYKLIPALFLGLIASAHANLITNGSFESGNYSWNGSGGESLGLGSTDITGWTVVSAELAPLNVGNSYGLTAEDGNISLDLTGYHDSSPYGGVEQTFATVANQEYNLQFYVGVQNANGSYAAPNSVAASINHGNATIFTNSSTAAGEQWILASENFIATSSSTTLDLVGQSSAGGQYIGLDNVSVQAVPEPSGLIVLAGLGIVALIRTKKA